MQAVIACSREHLGLLIFRAPRVNGSVNQTTEGLLINDLTLYSAIYSAEIASVISTIPCLGGLLAGCPEGKAPYNCDFRQYCLINR